MNLSLFLLFISGLGPFSEVLHQQDTLMQIESNTTFSNVKIELNALESRIEEYLSTDIRKAEQLALEGKALSDSLSIFDKKIVFLEYLFRIAKESGRYEEAYRYGLELTDFKDELTKELGSMVYEDVISNRESEQRNRELELLKKESSLQEIKLNQNRNTFYVLVTVALLIILLIVLGYTRFQWKQRSIKNIQERNDYLLLQNQELDQKNRKLLQSEIDLKELNETKDRFFTIISQDMRSPLNSLSGFLKLLITYANSFTAEEMIELARKINVSVHKLSGLIDNLLKWSRSQMGNIDFQPRNIEFTEVVMDVVDHMRPQFESKSIEVNVKATDTYTVFADEEMLFFAIKNLLDNAIKFSPENEKIDILLEADDWTVTLRIIDRGKGVDSSIKENIWNVTEQLRTKKYLSGDGSGLGLVLAKEFVEKNQGEIGLNKAKLNGSEFWFTLPLNYSS